MLAGVVRLFHAGIAHGTGVFEYDEALTVHDLIPVAQTDPALDRAATAGASDAYR